MQVALAGSRPAGACLAQVQPSPIAWKTNVCCPAGSSTSAGTGSQGPLEKLVKGWLVNSFVLLFGAVVLGVGTTLLLEIVNTVSPLGGAPLPVFIVTAHWMTVATSAPATTVIPVAVAVALAEIVTV